MNEFQNLNPNDATSNVALQELKLQEILAYVAQHSPFYKRHFAKNNIDIASIKSIANLNKIPTTDKEDLQRYNQDFICVDRSKIIDYVTTSGTLGDPVTFILTDKDLDRLAYNEYRSLTTAGITANDIVQLTVTLDRRFMAGLAYFSGLRQIGAAAIRVGPGNPELQWDTIQRIKPNVLIAVPSFVIRLIDFAKQKNIDFKNSSIQKIICVGEPIRHQDFSLNEVGNRINAEWAVSLHSTYASTEMGTAFTECEVGRGGHLIPELAIIESLDLAGNPVADGEVGELIVTTLGTEGMPLIRFKTGDLCIIHKSLDNHQNLSWRIGPIVGRKSHMIKYKGTTLYPQALNDVLNGIPEVDNYYIEVSTNNLDTDELVAFVHAPNVTAELEKQIKDTFRAKLRVAPTIKFVAAAEIEKVKANPIQRKPVDFIDLR